jgi:hypothetical protein
VHALGVVVLGKGKVMMGIEPAMMGAAQGSERSKFKHDGSPVDGGYHPAVHDR